MKKTISLVLVAAFVLSLMVSGAVQPAAAQTVSTAPTELEPVLFNFSVGICRRAWK